LSSKEEDREWRRKEENGREKKIVVANLEQRESMGNIVSKK